MYLFVCRKARSWSKALIFFSSDTLHEVFTKMSLKVSQFLEEAKPLFRNFSKIPLCLWASKGGLKLQEITTEKASGKMLCKF